MDDLLIIEDDASTRVRLVNIFKRKGFYVRQASNLDQAYQLFYNKRPDAILMDLHFPEGHSIEDFYTNILTLQEKKGETPCPITVLTGSDAEEDLKELLACGIYMIHSKNDPIDNVEITIRKQISEQKRAKLQVLVGRGKKQKLNINKSIPMPLQNYSVDGGI